MTQKELNELIDRITTDAYGDAEQMQAFHQAFEDEVATPFDATLAGDAVRVIRFSFDGNTLRGVTARCVTAREAIAEVSAADVAPYAGSPAAPYLNAYRVWMGLRPVTVAAGPAAALGTVELAVLSVQDKGMRCRELGSGEAVTLRTTAARLYVAPGEIVTVHPQRRWNYAGKPCIAGDIGGIRMDAAALGLTPLRLNPAGRWDPAKESWGAEGEPIPAWAKAIAARGVRPMFEMEQASPGFGGSPESDSIGRAVDLAESGNSKAAVRILMDACEADLRQLDAHAHLGLMLFNRDPVRALRHYHAGVRIGELSLGPDFDGLLPWVCLDNRPFLRCLHGFGLCLWRLREFKDAYSVLERLLWLNPVDNQGVRFNIGDVKARRSRRPDYS